MFINMHIALDCAFALLFLQVFGVKWMVQAVDGLSWGMTPLSARGQTTALIAGLAFIWAPYLLIGWGMFGHTPVDMFNTIPHMWAMGYLVTYATAILVASCFLSIPMTPVSIFMIHRNRQREIRYATSMYRSS